MEGKMPTHSAQPTKDAAMTTEDGRKTVEVPAAKTAEDKKKANMDRKALEELINRAVAERHGKSLVEKASFKGILQEVANLCGISLPKKLLSQRRDIEALLKKSEAQRAKNEEAALATTLSATIMALEALGLSDPLTKVGAIAVAETVLKLQKPAVVIPLLESIVAQDPEHAGMAYPLELLIACLRAVQPTPPQALKHWLEVKYQNDRANKKDNLVLAVDMRMISGALFQSRDFQAAIDWLQQALPLDSEALGAAHIQVGVDHMSLAKMHVCMQNFIPAIEHNLKALEILRPLKPELALEVLSTLDRLFRKLGRTDCAEAVQCRAIQASLEKGAQDTEGAPAVAMASS